MTRLPLLAGLTACALALGAACSAVQAATFSLVGGTDYVLPANYDPRPGSPDLAPGTTVQRNAALMLDGPGHVTFSYVGSEAGWRNLFTVGDTTIFDNRASRNPPVTMTFASGGLLDFAFKTVNPAGTTPNGDSVGFAPSIALFMLSGTSVYALFNDASKSDRDYDDLVVRMDVAPIPLPAAGFLLLAGLGGLAAAGRRRPAALA